MASKVEEILDKADEFTYRNKDISNSYLMHYNQCLYNPTEAFSIESIDDCGKWFAFFKAACKSGLLRQDIISRVKQIIANCEDSSKVEPCLYDSLEQIAFSAYASVLFE
jgi:hypothetical protein